MHTERDKYTIYVCDICDSRWYGERDALRCENNHRSQEEWINNNPCPFSLGDVVKARRGARTWDFIEIKKIVCCNVGFTDQPSFSWILYDSHKRRDYREVKLHMIAKEKDKLIKEMKSIETRESFEGYTKEVFFNKKTGQVQLIISSKPRSDYEYM